MSGFFNRIARLATFGKTKRLVGRDLEGNKYFELPPANGGRTKRVVEYKVERDIADYTNGINRLPIQWTTWLSHTRADPPSLSELQTDYSRQERLQPMIAAIEEREREERIRQGYLAAPGQEGGAVGQIAGPSSSASGYQEGKHSGMRYHLGSSGSAAGGAGSRMNAPPSFASPGAMSESASPSTSAAGESSAGGNDRHVDWQAKPAARWAYPISTPSRPDASTTTSQNAAPQQPYTVPTPTSSHVPPPAQSVDPSKYDDPATLRRLAEEDTKRRMQSADVPTPPSVGPAAQSSRIKPRRRGAAQ